MKKVILVIFGVIQVLTAQVKFTGGFGINYNYIYGYDWKYGELWNYWWSYEEFYGFYLTRASYGYNTLDYLRFKNPFATSGLIQAGLKWTSGEFNVEYISFGYVYAHRFYHPNPTQGVMYYVRLWNSNLFPVVNTENKPSFASPIDLTTIRDFNYARISAKLRIKNLTLNFFYSWIYNNERILYKQYARYFDIWKNDITLDDRSENRQELLFLTAGYANKAETYFYKILAGVQFELAVGAGANILKMKNDWIDIDDAWLYSGKPSDSLKVYYHGHAVNYGRFVRPNVAGNIGLSFYVYPEKSLKFYSGLNLFIVPDLLLRTYLDWPWGVGVDVNVPSGMKWSEIKRTVIFGNVVLIGITAEF